MSLVEVGKVEVEACSKQQLCRLRYSQQAGLVELRLD